MNPWRKKRQSSEPASRQVAPSDASFSNLLSTLAEKVSAMSQQITDFVAKVEQLIAAKSSDAAQIATLKQQVADLQSQIAAGALSPDDQAAVTAESAKIDAALAA